MEPEESEGGSLERIFNHVNISYMASNCLSIEYFIDYGIAYASMIIQLIL